MISSRSFFGSSLAFRVKVCYHGYAPMKGDCVICFYMVAQQTVYDQKRLAFLGLSRDEKVQIVTEGLRQLAGAPSIDTILSAIETGMELSDERLLEIYVALLIGQHASTAKEFQDARARLESVSDDMIRIRAQEQAEKQAEKASSDAMIAGVMF